MFSGQPAMITQRLPGLSDDMYIPHFNNYAAAPMVAAIILP
jgi:hypothetical protein